jgi:hypothetical protein
LGAAELDQAGDDVQAVGGLVGLGAKRVRERLDGAELARERLHLRAISERDDGADAPAVALDGAAGGQQHAVAGDQRRVVSELAGPERLELAAEQAVRVVVDEGRATLFVEHDHAFSERVEGRVVASRWWSGSTAS